MNRKKWLKGYFFCFLLYFDVKVAHNSWYEDVKTGFRHRRFRIHIAAFRKNFFSIARELFFKKIEKLISSERD